MAKKKSDNRPKQKEFQSTPFTPLKSMVLPDKVPVEPKKPVACTPVKPADNGLNLFLEEVNRLKMDSKFADEMPDDGEMKLLSGNRLRQVKRGVVSVEYQLDLHGLTREKALTALPGFLRSARRTGQKAVLVITGKGNHSVEEPVLQKAISSWLRSPGLEHVLEFAPAPREMGGSGAFVIFLRPQPVLS